MYGPFAICVKKERP